MSGMIPQVVAELGQLIPRRLARKFDRDQPAFINQAALFKRVRRLSQQGKFARGWGSIESGRRRGGGLVANVQLGVRADGQAVIQRCFAVEEYFAVAQEAQAISLVGAGWKIVISIHAVTIKEAAEVHFQSRRSR